MGCEQKKQIRRNVQTYKPMFKVQTSQKSAVIIKQIEVKREKVKDLPEEAEELSRNAKEIKENNKESKPHPIPRSPSKKRRKNEM